MLLALDLGTTTGWATLDAQGAIQSGTVGLRPHGARFEGGGMRFLRFRRWLEGLALTSADEVAFEEVRRHMSTDAAHVYGGLLATLTAHCEEHHVPYRGVPVGTIKLAWTGKGNASKGDMIDAAEARGFAPADDNEADALALLAHMHQEAGA